jgi:hypothetical protein
MTCSSNLFSSPATVILSVLQIHSPNTYRMKNGHIKGYRSKIHRLNPSQKLKTNASRIMPRIEN